MMGATSIPRCWVFGMRQLKESGPSAISPRSFVLAESGPFEDYFGVELLDGYRSGKVMRFKLRDLLVSQTVTAV